MLNLATRRSLLHPPNPYLLRDEFTTALATGLISNTFAEPGPGVRTVVDVEGKLSITGGQLVISGGKATPATGDPGLWYQAMARVPGRIALFDFLVSSFSGLCPMMGWDNNQTGISGSNTIYALNSTTLRVIEGADSALVATYAVGTRYQIAVVLRSSGAFYFIKGGAFTNWTLIWHSTVLSTASVFPMLVTNASAFNSEFVRVPNTVWLPTPLVSDGFASSFGTSDGLAHLETFGLGSGGAGVSWTQALGTWTVSGAKAAASALSGGEAVATVPVSHADTLISVELVRSAGVIGGVARYTDTDNCLRFYHDGTNSKLDEVVAGAVTNRISAAATYSANARMMLWLNGTSARLYYNNVLTGSTALINAGLTAAVVGIRTTDTGNTNDNFLVYTKGSANEHATLDSFL